MGEKKGEWSPTATASRRRSSSGGSSVRSGVSRALLNSHLSSESNLLNQPKTGVDEIVAALEDPLRRLRQANPAAAVTLTVSPVRHLRNAQGPGASVEGRFVKESANWC